MIAYCFPGQGPQTVELIAQLRELPDYALYRDQVLAGTGFDLDSLFELSEEEQQTVIHRNEVASLLTVLYALDDYKNFKSESAPDFLTGYSVGQYLALHVAGCFDQETLFSLVWQRCLFMNEADAKKNGRMAAFIGLQLDALEPLCKEYNLEISNYNARGNYTLAGALPDLEKAVEKALELGAHQCALINTQGGWHSSFMASAEALFEEFLKNIEFSSPQVPTIDNVTGELFGSDIEQIKAQLVLHLSHAVQWEAGIRTLMDKGSKEFIEFGYGNMLSKFGFFISRDAEFKTSQQVRKAKACAA
ncbi:MAG: ACP S-malonyltransferase [Alphaproteobacteria bacterium]|nr:ACP S-malonyltransferase [Alphaproteobacteria bacterium]